MFYEVIRVVLRMYSTCGYAARRINWPQNYFFHHKKKEKKKLYCCCCTGMLLPVAMLSAPTRVASQGKIHATNAPTGRVDRNWTKSGGKAP